MQKELMLNDLHAIENFLRDECEYTPRHILDIVDDLRAEIIGVGHKHSAVYENEFDDFEDALCVNDDYYDLDNTKLTMQDYVTINRTYRFRDCRLDVTKFSRELVNTTSLTISSGILPSDADNILPAMKYTPSVLYLMVRLVLLDMGEDLMYNTVVLENFDYTVFRERLAKLILNSLGVTQNAVIENIYSNDEQVDMYESLQLGIDDAMYVSVKLLE